jgi:AcrR family transcriptional regulator
MQTSWPTEKRVARTRAAILNAFLELVLKRRYEAIRIPDLVANAGIGRATFYEHFRGKDDALLAAIEPLLIALSTAASGRAARPYVKNVMSHLWERRATGRHILNSTAAPVVQRRLATLLRSQVERAGGGTPSIRSAGIAAAQIAILRSWLTGEASCTVDELTDQMIECSRLIA